MPSDARKRDRDRDERKPSLRRDRDVERKDKKHSRSGDDKKRDRDDRERRRHRKSSRTSRDEAEQEGKRRKHHDKKSDRDLVEDASDGSRRRRRSKHSGDSRRHHSSDRGRDRETSKSSKHSSSRKKEKEGRTGTDTHNAVKLYDIGPKAETPPSVPLDPSNDYFSYHNHLRLYLYRSEGTCFEDLSSSETHKAFKKFCSKYNKGELEQGFYAKELSEDALEQCKRTKHAWNFNTSAAENKSLDLIRSGVKKQTAYDVKDPISVSNSVKKGPMLCAPASSGTIGTNSGGQPTKRAMIVPRDDAKEVQRFQSAISKGNEKRNEQEAVLKSLGLGGLKPGEKITIAPRK
jgi:hypothetical protein